MYGVLTPETHWQQHTEPFAKQALIFSCLQYMSFENTVGKGEITHIKLFLLFIYLFWQHLYTIFLHARFKQYHIMCMYSVKGFYRVYCDSNKRVPNHGKKTFAECQYQISSSEHAQRQAHVMS